MLGFGRFLKWCAIGLLYLVAIGVFCCLAPICYDFMKIGDVHPATKIFTERLWIVVICCVPLSMFLGIIGSLFAYCGNPEKHR